MDQETLHLIRRLQKKYPSYDVTERYLPMLQMLGRAKLTVDEWAGLMNFSPNAVAETAELLGRAGVVRKGSRGGTTTWELTQAGRDLINRS